MSIERVEIRTPESRYTIHVGAGLLGELPRLLGESAPAAGYAVISDDRVGPLYGEPVRASVAAALAPARLLTFPAGEASKTREGWARLTDTLLETGLGRDGCVVAVGGGVTGDLAGFVAATYLRGIPWVQVPTSLLAMVDASVGGKTAVDTPRGKNLVGAFHQPACVVADTATLDTLPGPELRAGLAEVVKHACIAEEDELDRVTEAGLPAPAALSGIVARSVRIKARFVEPDVRESGPRMALNFGHTVAHAIEAETGYAVPHGLAVARGMVAESLIGEAAGVTEPGTTNRIRLALERLSLPTGGAGRSAEGLLDAMSADKKRRSGRTRFTLLRRVGEVARTPQGHWTFELPEAPVREALERWIGTPDPGDPEGGAGCA